MKINLLILFAIIFLGIFSFQIVGFENLFNTDKPFKNKQTLLKPKLEKIEIDYSKIDKTGLMVALAFGQSNSANYGETRYASTENVYNFSRGKFYLAADPLVGAEGDKGSAWTRLGDKLIQKNRYQNIIFVPIGVGGTSISQWSPGGNLHQRLINNIKHAKKSGLTFTHLLWHQGETDLYQLKTSKESYQQHFNNMLESIRKLGVTAPIYVSIASISKYSYDNLNNPISTAQQALINHKDVLLGPNTDHLGLNYRYDGNHFSTKGLELYSNLWFEALTAQ